MLPVTRLDEPPKCKNGLPDFPRFLSRTRRQGRRWRALWECRCGTQFEANVENVTSRHTTSCGCALDRARHRSFPKHGHATIAVGKRSPTYKSWQAMIARCTNPKHPRFKHYGGRGITICPHWLASFENFLADMGERPTGLTLDRKDANGNYEPGNVRWADAITQRHNRANPRTVKAKV